MRNYTTQMDAARKGGSMPTVFNAANELSLLKLRL